MLKRKWVKRAAILLLAFAASQLAASLAMRAGRIHRYLAGRLEAAFGRPVEVGHFDLRLLPSPRIQAESVTVGEDPGFGYEYFLRADRVTAGLRWSGLLRGHFELSTFSFTRPSLTLARNAAGRWNLERWLPPARSPRSATQPGRAAGTATLIGPMPPPSRAVNLLRVEFDEGRINFMNGAAKLPFAFTAVNGSVEQESPGRWKLRLEAKPWRSAAALQEAGTVEVRGEVAGTSARLQPAEIQLHWGGASLADLFRLARGQDFGLRGEVALDASIYSRAQEATTAPTGEWSFNLEATARAIHRWNLTERQDNPAVNARLSGIWNVPANRVRVERLIVEGPRSNAQGDAQLSLADSAAMELRLNSAGVQASDVLAWCRAFHSGIAAGVAAEGYLTGAATLEGWPPAVRNLAFSSRGVRVKMPGLREPVRVGPFEGGRTRELLELEPVKILLGPSKAQAPGLGSAKAAGARTRRPGAGEANSLLVSAAHDVTTRQGVISLEGTTEHAEEVLAMLAALGHPLQHGWELEGRATASLRWTWAGTANPGGLSGHIDLENSRLQVAGLNRPLEVDEAQIVWRDGGRSVHLGSLRGFGGTWDGELVEDQPLPRVGGRGWKFRLHADAADVAELDRWVGPRARPNWLERLLPSLLGNATPQVSASELIRRLRAEGELRVDELRVEKVLLSDFRARAALRDFRLELEDAVAQWAGGSVKGTMSAEFAPRPRYRVSAEFDRLRLADLPNSKGQAERFDGLASGEVSLAADGVGREELLHTLAGKGRTELRNVEFRGWDVAGSLALGAPRVGISRWKEGRGAFTIQDGSIALESLALTAPQGALLVRGTIGFGRGSDLRFSEVPVRSSSRPRASRDTGGIQVLKVTGSLDVPQVSVEKQSF